MDKMIKSVSEFIKENFDETVRTNQTDNGSLIGLPKPYTVPCASGSFQELYYWDTYFANLGLLALGNAEQAKNNVDNILFLINKYGFMPNCNRTWATNRSQPPFSYLMVKDVFGALRDKEWLLSAYNTLKKEYEFWQTRRAVENGLNIYRGSNELTDWEINSLFKDYEKRCGKKLPENLSLSEKIKIAQTVMTFVESGWDCCSRFGTDGYAVNPIDLNSLLYGFENEMAGFSRILCIGEENGWLNKAEERKQKMNLYMLDGKTGIYNDYNFNSDKLSDVLSAASFFPAFSGVSDNGDAVNHLVCALELPFGISASVEINNGTSFQWDYPNVWAALQYIAFIACKNCGLNSQAKKIAETYIALIDKTYFETGNLWEKYNGIEGSVSNHDYNAPPMLGWTAGVYMFLKSII